MKIKEYYRLARLSLKYNKKATRATVRGLAFGFILIIPIILALTGIGSSINGYLNQKPHFNYYHLEMADYRTITEDILQEQNGKEVNLSGSKHLDKLMKAPDALSQIVYEKYVLNSTNKYIIMKDGIEIDMGRMDSDINKRYNVVDIDKSSSIFPASLLNRYQGGIFLRGSNFSGDGKSEVIVSQRFVEALNMGVDDVINGYLTISVTQLPKLDKNLIIEEGAEYYLCTSYKVIGIVSSEVADEFDNGEYMHGSLFFTSSNVYNANGIGVLKGRQLNGGYVTFDNWDNIKILNKEYMMLGSPTIDTNGGNNSITLATTSLYAESSSFAGLTEALKYTNSYLYNNFILDKDMIQVSYTYATYKRIFDLSNMAIFAILTVGIVLLLCAIINLGGTMAHSVKEKSRYLTMLRAIGANSDTIPKLYLLEAFIIIARASAYVLTIGVAVSVGIKLLLNMVIKNAAITIPINIPWWSIALSVVVSIGVLVSIGICLAYVMTHKLSKASIVDKLKVGA